MEERIMDKVTIVFWSQSGNTESMANAVAEGVTDARLGRPHDSSRSNRYERRGRDLPGSTGRCSLRCMQRPRKTARSIIIR